MAKSTRKKKSKLGIQIGLFDQEMRKPVDLHKEPPTKTMVDMPVKPPEEPRLKIVIGSTKSCPHCGEDIKLAPDGTVRCTKCWWWQGVNE